MNKLIIITIVLLSLSFNTSQQQPETIQETITNKEPETFDDVTVNHKDYMLKISLENTNTKNPILVIEMELKKNVHFISPIEEKEFTGKFHFDFGSYKDLTFEGKVSETPISKAIVLYPNFNSNEATKWVTENTTYKQILKLNTTKDFEVYGRIQFTIEPSCTFEEIPFAILYKDGKFTFTDAKC